jgi:hypothetical protein
MGNADASVNGDDRRESIIVAAWFILFLAAADVAVSLVFPLPSDPRKKASSLAEYFHYGLSTSAKIRRAIGPTNEKSAPLMLAGWIDDEVARGRRETKAPPGGLLVSFYGMSFSNDVAKTVAELDANVRVRTFSGPAAPPNHSFAIYSRDRGGDSQVVVLAVLGSSVPGLVTNNGMTWRFEGPAPFVYPRYELQGNELVAQWPLIRTLDDVRARLGDPLGWARYRAQLRATDDFYNEFLFRRDIGDHSSLARMVRRAVAQRWQASCIARIHGPTGFVESSPAIASLRGIVAEFASISRRNSKIPIVLLIQDQGYRDHVYRALEPVLQSSRIPHISTHTIAPDTDRRNFIADGHFTEEAYKKIAKGLLDLIDGELKRRS